MENFFLTRNTTDSLELFLFLAMFLILAIIRNANPVYSYFLFNNLFLKKDRFESSISGRSIQNKSSVFVTLIFLIGSAIFLGKIFPIQFYRIFLFLVFFAGIQSAAIFAFEKTFITKSQLVSFTKRRLALTEIMGIVVLVFLFTSNAFYIPTQVYFLLMTLMLIVVWSKTVAILSEYLSILHIILYLCTLEILPVLILVKFIYKHLA